LSQQTPRVQSRGLTTKGILRHDGIHTDLPRGDRSARPQGLLHHLPCPVIPRLALHRRLDGGQRVVAMPGRLGVRTGIAAAEYDRQIPPSVRRQFDLVGGAEGEERRPPGGSGRLHEGEGYRAADDVPLVYQNDPVRRDVARQVSVPRVPRQRVAGAARPRQREGPGAVVWGKIDAKGK